MRLVALALVLLAGCSDDGDNRPRIPGPPGAVGTGGSGGATVDAGTTFVRGQVCVMHARPSLLDSQACDTRVLRPTTAIRIRETDEFITVGSFGDFRFQTTGPVTLELVRSPTDYAVPAVTVVPAGVSTVELKTFDEVLFNQLLSDSNITWTTDDGFVVVFVVESGAPAANVTAQSITPAPLLPYYDEGPGIDQLAPQGSTQGDGVVAFPNVPPGNMSLQLARGGQTLSLAGLVSVAGDVTIVSVTLP